MLGCAVHADFPGITKLQQIIYIITRSYIFDIGETATADNSHFNNEKSAFAFDIENTWPQINVTDSSLVQREAEMIFGEVQKLAELLGQPLTSSTNIVDLAWWSLSSWLACVVAVCCAAGLTIDPKHTAVITNIERIITGDFPVEALSEELAHHPLARIYLGR